MTNNNSNEPQAWVGCLRCYNEGRLVGEWVPAIDAAHVTPQDIHPAKSSQGCEEMWVFDTEYMPPGYGEMSRTEAHDIGHLYLRIGEDDWTAYLAYCEETGDEGSGSRTRFYEAYQGWWPSFSDYLTEPIEAMQAGWPEEAVRYFDYDQYERDASFGYIVCDAPDGGVYVFQDC